MIKIHFKIIVFACMIFYPILCIKVIPAYAGIHLNNLDPRVHGDDEHSAKKIDVFVSIAPQQFFVQRIAGKTVNTHILIKPGDSPHTFFPSPSQMAILSKSKIFFTIGLSFENSLIEKIKQSNKDLIIIHKKNYEHIDRHTWLDPNLAIIQSKEIGNALIQIMPEQKKTFEKNLTKLIADLKNLDLKIKNTLLPFSKKVFFVYHPSFGYFATAYNLKQIAIENNGKKPSAKQMLELIDLGKKENINTIFIEPQFSKTESKKIADSLNAKIVAIDPLNGDYINNLLNITEKLKESWNN